MRLFLDKFKDIYDYCEEIYHIDDKEFIDELCEFGSKAIETPEMVSQYIEYAFKFWTSKNEFYKKADDEVKRKYEVMRKKLIEARGLIYTNMYTGTNDTKIS